MKKTFLLCILFALCSGGATRLLAAINPGERFLDAFFLIQDGDAAQAKSDWQTAYDKYAAALTVLQEIKAQAPDWNTRLVEYRTGYCSGHLAEIKPNLPPPAPPAPEAAPAPATPEAVAPVPVVSPAPAAPVSVAPAPAAPVAEATPAENGQIQQLTDELRQSQEKFRQMEQDRDALKARLDEELNKPAPSNRAEAQKALDQLHALEAVRDALNAKLQDAEAKAVQVETLKADLQKSQEKVRQLEASQAELTAQAAKSQQEIQRLEATESSQTEQAAKSQEKIRQLEASQADLKAKLKEALSKAPAARPAAQTGDWQKKNAELAAKLAETERQLRAAKSSNEKNSEIIVALRQENEQLHQALNRAPATNMAEPEETETSSGLNTELRGWHPRRLSQASEEASSRPAPPKQTATAATTTEPGNNKKLVATINAPRPAQPAVAKTNVVQVVPAPVKTNTVQAAAAPVTPTPVMTNTAPAAPAPVAPAPVAETSVAAQAAPAPVAEPLVRVTKVNNTYRFVVIDFSSHAMPALGTRLSVYRDGKQVGVVQLTEPVRDRFATADILQGELHVGDEPR